MVLRLLFSDGLIRQVGVVLCLLLAAASLHCRKKVPSSRPMPSPANPGATRLEAVPTCPRDPRLLENALQAGEYDQAVEIFEASGCEAGEVGLDPPAGWRLALAYALADLERRSYEKSRKLFLARVGEDDAQDSLARICLALLDVLEEKEAALTESQSKIRRLEEEQEKLKAIILGESPSRPPPG